MPKEDLENESGYTQSGTCELAIPEEFCTADVQFAFRFYKTAYTGGDPAAVDNVSLTVPDGAGETGHTLRAAATEGGTIAPTGDTVVADGASQTFTLMPDENCRLVSLRVNGRAVDVTDSYTLEHVDQSYYLLATFEAIEEEPQVIFEQDFEGPWIPAGWSVEGVNTDFTWKQYKYYYFNGTQNAYITADYSTGAAQDERLVTPTVDLTGATKMELDFAYAYPYYGMKKAVSSPSPWRFPRMAAGLGPRSGTPGYDSPSQSGYVVTGQAAVEIPEAYGTSGVTFAFHYTRPAGENTGIAAVDNLKLLAVGGQTASGVHHHSNGRDRRRCDPQRHGFGCGPWQSDLCCDGRCRLRNCRCDRGRPERWGGGGVHLPRCDPEPYHPCGLPACRQRHV